MSTLDKLVIAAITTIGVAFIVSAIWPRGKQAAPPNTCPNLAPVEERKLSPADEDWERFFAGLNKE